MNMKKRCWVIKGRYNYHFLWNVYLHSAHCLCTVLTAAGCEWLKWKAKFKSIFWLKLSFFLSENFKSLIWSPSSNDFCPPCFQILSRSLVCQDGMTYAWTQWLAYEKLLHIWPLMFIHFLIYVCIFVCVHSSVEITLRHSKEREDRREKEEKKLKT